MFRVTRHAQIDSESGEWHLTETVGNGGMGMMAPSPLQAPWEWVLFDDLEDLLLDDENLSDL